jgi:hypothetical protein
MQQRHRGTRYGIHRADMGRSLLRPYEEHWGV